MNEEIQKDFVLDTDIPNPVNWKRYDLETLKEKLCLWLDWNMEQQMESHPDIFMKEEEKRLHIHIKEEGGKDKDLRKELFKENPDDEYYMLIETFDNNEIVNN